MSDKKFIITAYVTKYWETRGIVEAWGYISDGGYFYSKSFDTNFNSENFFLTKEEAIKKVESRRKKKLLSLKKKYDKIEKMTFQ